VAVHAKGSQVTASGARHCVAAQVGVAVKKPLAQYDSPQSSPVAVAHAVRFVPSQNSPHAPEPGHAGRPFLGGPLLATQVPSWPDRSQASQRPVHPVSQHTPSMQLLLVQWRGAAHGAPSASRGAQMPPEQ
jgi:hypothetical protein